MVAESVVQQLPAAFTALQGAGCGGQATRACHQKLNAKRLLPAVLGHGDKAMVLQAMMEAMVLAMSRAQGMAPAAPPAWAFQHKYGQLRVWASSLRERPLAVLLLALLAQCKLVAVPALLPVVEFLMILGGLAFCISGRY